MRQRRASCRQVCQHKPIIPRAIDSTAQNGEPVSRRRFQKGSVYQNRANTLWLGAYSEYALDVHGVEKRLRRQVTLSPIRKPDGTTVRKAEAKQLLQPYLNRVNDGIGLPTRERKNGTFETFCVIWQRDYLKLSKPSTQSSSRTQLKTLKAEFGALDMRQIDAGHVQRLIARLTATGLSAKTIRNLWGTISLIWQAALAQHYVDAVLPKPKLPKRSKHKPRFFSLTEVAAIIAATHPDSTQRAFYWLLAETGIRCGELAGIRLTDVSLDRIEVQQSIWCGKQQTPKSESAVRTIAISPRLAELLWAQRSRQKALGYTFLFTAGNGSPLDMNTERARRLHRVLKALELPRAGYHAFRHFNVSLMDVLRVPLKTIQERIGHSLTGAFTLDVYGHALDWKANEEVASAIAARLAEAIGPADGESKASADSECLTAVA